MTDSHTTHQVMKEEETGGSAVDANHRRIDKGRRT